MMKVLALVLAFAAAAVAVDYPYATLLRSGQPAGAKYPFGTVVNQDMMPVKTNILDGESYANWNASAPSDAQTITAVSNNPDFFSLHAIKEGEVVGLIHFESPNPSQIYTVPFTQDPKTGKLVAQSSLNPIDASQVGGFWILCAGSKTPWGVHLGGEEYEPDARAWENAKCLMESQCGADSLEATSASYGGIISMLRYFDIYANSGTKMEEARNVFNPYMYGYAVAAEPVSFTQAKTSKIYTTGRLAKELIYVMPDNRTVYMTDDGTNVGFFRLVLDTPADFSSGTLYAGKFTQTSANDGGSYKIGWIELGSGNNEKIKKMSETLKFSDIFESTKPASGSCPDGFTSVNQGGIGQECLKLKQGMENAAAFLETRRYAAMLGATTEFSKWEGLVYDPNTNKIYTSISDVRYGMEDSMKKGEDNTKYDVGDSNDVRVPYQKCGCVMQLSVDSNYKVTAMSGALCGKPEKVDDYNGCALGGLANPDNIARIGKHIIIGEDTGSGHRNDAVWAWMPTTGELTRIATTPYGSEATGIAFYENINGFNYLTLVTQHPYGESDLDMADTTVNPAFDGKGGYVGAWTLPGDVNVDSISFGSVPVPQTFVGQSALNVAPIKV